MNITNIDDFISQMRNREISVSSFDDIRNEKLQKKENNRRIGFFKKEKNTNYKLLPLKTIAFPFDPFTMQVGEFNEDNKFRTESSAETMILAFKRVYANDEELKAKFIKRAKVDSWDTSNLEKVTKEDIAVFSEFTHPFVFTLQLIHINDKVITGDANGKDYRVTVVRDEVGNIVDTWTDKAGEEHITPQFIKRSMELASFYSQIALNKYNEWVVGEGANKTDDDKAKQRLAFLSASPISEERPRNYLLAFAFGMGDSLSLNEKELADVDEKNIGKYLKLVPLSGKLKDQIALFKSTYAKRDVYPSFYEMDVIVPDIEDPKERGQKTNWNTAEEKLSEYENQELIQKVCSATSTHIDEKKEIEKVFLGSSYVQPYTETIYKALVERIAETEDLNKLGVTNEIAMRYANLLTDVFGSKAAAILSDAEFGDLKSAELADSKVLEDARKGLADAFSAEDDMEEIEINED